MYITRVLAVVLFGGTFATAQLTNTNIFELLNSSQVSPAYKFAQFLQSSQEYAPIVQLLSQPGNYTLFVPSDDAIQQVFPQSNASSSAPQNSSSAPSGLPSTTTGPSPTDQGSPQPSSQPSPIQSPESGQTQPNASTGGLFGSIRLTVPPRLKDVSGFSELLQPLSGPRHKVDILNALSGSTLRHFQAEQQPTISNGVDSFSISDVIYYHLVNQSVPLDGSSAPVSIVNSVMANATVDKIGAGMPLIISNSSQSNDTDSQSSDSQSSDNQSSPQYQVGNGAGFAKIVTPGIKTSNGIIHVIDKVLVPPQKPATLLQSLPNISILHFFLQQMPDVGEKLDSLSNVTIFAPTNAAFQSFDYKQLDNETLQRLAYSHICEGAIYSTNLTDNSANMTIQSMSGEALNLTSINSTSFNVNNATVVQPNVLMDSGVVHIIDQLVVQPQPPAPSNTSSGGPFPTQGSSFAEHSSAPNTVYMLALALISQLAWLV